ncbi:NAD(P)-dependent oxidoreductase [Poseidonocella sp. HB161398]|uniref:NAD-dependent epimerase/dehydratase family protein n=1 Tax=Poseidonocella sp. HB161398 TaxID=2320855 RepID=UPI0011087D4B|nr:NAD-dependent epimerase/dehydratase family protein [Poseidonocella sp. HB161398]
MTQPLYLVTGAAGFVGNALVTHLAQQGVRVRAMVRRESQAAALASRVEEVVIGDLQDPASLGPAVEGVAGIYNIAAVFRSDSIPDATFYDINAEGVRRLMEAAIAAGVPRVVHCSTNGVHSHIAQPPASETAPFNPSDVYQDSKLKGEMIAMEYFRSGRIRGAVIRPAMIYGAGDQRTLKLFRMISKRQFFYVGKGNALTHWVDVKDLARSFELAMMREEVNAEAFLVAGESYQPLRDCVREIASQLQVPEPKLHLPVAPVMALAHLTEKACKPFGIEPPLFPRRVAFFLKNRAFDISKARSMLGYAPSSSFADEIRDIIAASRKSGDIA